ILNVYPDALSRMYTDVFNENNTMSWGTIPSIKFAIHANEKLKDSEVLSIESMNNVKPKTKAQLAKLSKKSVNFLGEEMSDKKLIKDMKNYSSPHSMDKIIKDIGTERTSFNQNELISMNSISLKDFVKSSSPLPSISNILLPEKASLANYNYQYSKNLINDMDVDLNTEIRIRTC